MRKGSHHTEGARQKLKGNRNALGHTLPKGTRKGEKNPNWKGGVTYCNDRKMVRAPGERYAYEHRVMAEVKLGRKLTREETVHHRNGDRTNNEEWNLMVFCSTGDHTKFHKGRTVEALDLAEVSPEWKMTQTEVAGGRFSYG